jgi:hypothetical protein
MPEILPIPRTLGVVSKYWEQAEAELRNMVHTKYHDLDEETITILFHREYCFLLRKASRAHEISHAFLHDMHQAFPELSEAIELRAIAEDLIADVSLHSRRVEGRTGGDFGFTITRPQVDVIDLSSAVNFASFIAKNNDCPRLRTSEHQFGLLTQAKLKDRRGKWPGFSDNQEKYLPERMDFLALLLYHYSDERRESLLPFEWQVCQHRTMDEAREWLTSDDFPNRINSTNLIKQLGEGKIDTDNSGFLEQHIRPTGRPQLSIVVTWPIGKRPPEQIPTLSYARTGDVVPETQVLYVHDI